MNDLNKSNEEKPQNEMDLKYEINKIIDKDQELNNKENEKDLEVVKKDSKPNENEELSRSNDNNLDKSIFKKNLKKEYIKNKIIENGLKEELLFNINQEIENKNQNIYNNILAKNVSIGEVKLSVEDLIHNKKNKSHIKENTIEDSLRFQKIKDIKENKENIEFKIKSLEENIKILENNDLTRVDLNISIGGSREIIDDNIRKSRIKEIKNKKDILKNKLIYLDEQVQSLMKEEEFNSVNKKFNLKSYLDNFERDKKEAELREQKWKKEHEQRVKVFEEQQKKIQDRLKEKAENENLSNNLKKQENYLKILERVKLSAKLHREDIKKLEEMKEEWKLKPISENQYLFKLAEEEFKKKQLQLQEEEKIRFDNEIAKIKQNFKPITKEEIEEFRKNYEDQRQQLLYEKEKERLLKQEDIMQKNLNLPKVETQVHEKIIEEEKKNREIKEKEQKDKIYTNLKIKQFSKVIQTTMVPKLDENKKKEIEDRIQAEGQRPKGLVYNKNGRIILKKSNPENLKKKYKWELKLNSNDLPEEINNLEAINNNSISKGVYSSSALNKSRPFTGENRLRLSKSRSREKKVPLEKNPDYLTEMRIKKINDENNSNNTKSQNSPGNFNNL